VVSTDVPPHTVPPKIMQHKKCKLCIWKKLIMHLKNADFAAKSCIRRCYFIKLPCKCIFFWQKRLNFQQKNHKWHLMQWQ
jgi:hypothetical protein